MKMTSKIRMDLSNDLKIKGGLHIAGRHTELDIFSYDVFLLQLFKKIEDEKILALSYILHILNYSYFTEVNRPLIKVRLPSRSIMSSKSILTFALWTP